ncbi:hypothetical protein [Calothrix sp. 336/3]|uniref:hypothetical protein n=1 Tax=Calothrix sp. 336/3 TaxID=1337936 RepID=UPI00069B7CFA|nr:hypothetical protein [Calothrix sp. 336/3]
MQGNSQIKLFSACAVFTWLAMSLPHAAKAQITSSYSNDYRACVGQLKSIKAPLESAAEACATALRPRELSGCVVKIVKNRYKDVPYENALPACENARRPGELSKCVVGIFKYGKEVDDRSVLNHCGSSLLPVDFAHCVVGLRVETDIDALKAMDICIDGNDKIAGSSTPGSFQPTFETNPAQPEPQPEAQPEAQPQPEPQPEAQPDIKPQKY